MNPGTNEIYEVNKNNFKKSNTECSSVFTELHVLRKGQ